MKHRLSVHHAADLLSAMIELMAARLKVEHVVRCLEHERLETPEEERQPIEEMIAALTVFDLGWPIDRLEVVLDSNGEPDVDGPHARVDQS